MGDDLLSVRGRGSLLKSLSQDSEYSLDSSLFDAEEFLRDMGFAGAADPSIPDRFLPSLLQRLSKFPEAEMDSLHHRIVQSIGCFRRKEGKRRLFRNLSSGRSPHLNCPPSYPLLRSNTGPAAFPSTLPRDEDIEEEEEVKEVPHSPIAILVSAASTEDSSQFDSGQASVDLDDSDAEDHLTDPDDSGCYSVVVAATGPSGIVKDGCGNPLMMGLDEPCDRPGRQSGTRGCFGALSASSTLLDEEENGAVRQDVALKGVEFSETVESLSQKDSKAFHRPVERQNGANFCFRELEALSKDVELLKTDNTSSVNHSLDDDQTDNFNENKSRDSNCYNPAKNPFPPSSSAFSNLVMEVSGLACDKEQINKKDTFKSFSNENQPFECPNSDKDAVTCSEYVISAKGNLDYSANLLQTAGVRNDVNYLPTAKDHVDFIDIREYKKEVNDLIRNSDENNGFLGQHITTSDGECTLDEIAALINDMNQQTRMKTYKDNLQKSLPLPNSEGKECKTNNQDEKLLNFEVKQSKLPNVTNFEFPSNFKEMSCASEFSKPLKNAKNPFNTPTNTLKNLPYSSELEAVSSLDSAINCSKSTEGNIPVVVKNPLCRTSNLNNLCYSDTNPFRLSSKEIEGTGEWALLKTSERSSFDDTSTDDRSKSEDIISDPDLDVEPPSSANFSPPSKGGSLTSFLSSMLGTAERKEDELPVENSAAKPSVPNRKRRVLKRMSSSLQCCDEDDCRHHYGLAQDDSQSTPEPNYLTGTVINTEINNPIAGISDRHIYSSEVLPNSSSEGWLSTKSDLTPHSTVVPIKPKQALRNANSAPLGSSSSPFKVFSAKSSDIYRRKERRPCKRRRFLSCPSPTDLNFLPKFQTKEVTSSLLDLYTPDSFRCQESTSPPEGCIRPRPGFYIPRCSSPVRKFRSSDPPWTSSFPSRLSTKGHYLCNSSPDIHRSVSPDLVRKFRFGRTSPSDEVFYEDICCCCDSLRTRQSFRHPHRKDSMSYPDSKAPFAQQSVNRDCSHRHRSPEWLDSESHFPNDPMFLKKCQNCREQPLTRKISAPDYQTKPNVFQLHDPNYHKIPIAQNHDDNLRETYANQQLSYHRGSCPQRCSMFVPFESKKPSLQNSSSSRQSSDVLGCRCRNRLVSSRKSLSCGILNLRNGAPSDYSETSQLCRSSDVICERGKFSSGHFHSESLPEAPNEIASHSDSELNDCSVSSKIFCKHLTSNQSYCCGGFPKHRKSMLLTRLENSNSISNGTSITGLNGVENKSGSLGTALKFASVEAQPLQNKIPLSSIEKPLTLDIDSPKDEPVLIPNKSLNPFDSEFKNFESEKLLMHISLPKEAAHNPSPVETNISNSSKISRQFSCKLRNGAELKTSKTNYFPKNSERTSDNLLQISPQHPILQRSTSEKLPSSQSPNVQRSKSSPPSPNNKREAMLEKKIRIFSKFLTNLGNLSKPSASLSSSQPDNDCSPPGGSSRRCTTPPPVLNHHASPMFENRVLLETDGDQKSFQPVLYTSTVSMLINCEEETLTAKRDVSSDSSPKGNLSSHASPMPFNVVSKELEDLQISIQKAKETRLNASKELHLLQALLSKEEPTKNNRIENLFENPVEKESLQMKKSVTLQHLKERSHRRDETEEAAFWREEVERVRKETEQAWSEKVSRMSAQLSLQEAELQRLQKGISTESLQDAVPCHQCNGRVAAPDNQHHNGRTDSAFEDDEEYKPSIPIQSTRQECERLHERLTEEEQRADQLNLLLNQKTIEFNKLQLAYSKQTKEMIELEKSFLQLQCRMKRGSHRPRICSREGLATPEL